MNPPEDPFERLGAPRRFALEEAQVRELQRAALAEVHPDREPDPVRRAMALRASAAISAAARTLLDPKLRAEWLIRGTGVDPAPPPSSELLMEMLEWTERVDEARASGGEAIAAEVAALQTRRADLVRRLGEALDGGADPAPNRARLAAAMLTELRLVDRLLERARGA